ncbi:hypothetical protein D3C86_586500 [compost metagenome]
MSTPMNGAGGGYINQWADVVYTPRTDTISLPDDVPVTGQWADAISIPQDQPAAPSKTSWSDEVKLPNSDAPKPKSTSWTDNLEIVMPDPWKDRPRQGIPWEEMGEVFKAPPPKDPLVFDLNHDGKIGTTGETTAKDGTRSSLGRTVSFDIDGDGIKDEIEWLNGDGDGFLVDDRDGGATGAMLTGGEIDGKRLFGDEGGKFANGLDKLRAFDKDGDGKLTGAELEGLKIWVDNGDAKLDQGELKSLAELGITEISVMLHHEKNDRGETLERSSFVQDGQTRMSEDVWFGSK